MNLQNINQSTHLNTYEIEKSKDKLLLTIRIICLLYLEDKNKLTIETEKLEEYFEYIKYEYNQIAELKKSLKVKTYTQPYYEIFSNLDSMILKDNLIHAQEKIAFIELTKDINHLEETLGFCYGVLNLILKDKN